MRLHRRLITGLTVPILCVLGALSLTGCSADEPDGPRTVTLRVTSKGWTKADVSLTADDKASWFPSQSLPWSKKISYDSTDTLWLFAKYTYDPEKQSLGTTLSCEVLVDGKSVDTFRAESRRNDDGGAIVEEHAVCSYTPGE